MQIPDIYVHDGTLLEVVEEFGAARITMEVELPILGRDEQLEPRSLVFEDVREYKVVEGCISGHPTLLDFTVVGAQDQRTRVRLDTNIGYREILCASVKVHRQIL